MRLVIFKAEGSRQGAVDANYGSDYAIELIYRMLLIELYDFPNMIQQLFSVLPWFVGVLAGQQGLYANVRSVEETDDVKVPARISAPLAKWTGSSRAVGACERAES